MRLNFAIIIMAIVFAILSVPLWGGNSIFSYLGTAWQHYGNDIYGMSMGDVGVSDVFRKNTGFGNPAIMGAANRTLFSTGILFGWTSYKSGGETERTFRDQSLDFPYFSVTIPVNNHHFGFQFNSLASGVVQNETTFMADSLTILEKHSIDRYIYRADLMYALHYRYFNLGVGVNYYLGHDIRRFFQDGGYGVFNTSEKLERNYKNPSGSIGFTAERENMSLGAVYSHESNLKGELVRSSIHETENLGTVRYSIPSQLTAGYTYKYKDEYKVSTDYTLSLWESAKYSEYEHNSWKIGLGLAHEPKADTRRTILGQMPKRCGLYYRTLPFEANGNSVTETAVSAGLTIPIKQSENRLDIGIQYLWRGNVDEHNLQDRSLMFMFGVTGFDILTKAFSRSAPREIPQVEDISL